MPRTAVVFGATKGIGRALARQMAARGDRLFLLGRHREDLQRSASDLDVYGGSTPTQFALCDLERPDTFDAALAEAERALGGRIDVIVVTAALFATQADLEADLHLTERLLAANFTNTIMFCEHARRRLLASGGGTLCVFSSVAGERGRKPVILYGATKAGLTRYLEGLDHKFFAQGLRVVCVKPGFVRTSMTSGLPEPPFAADADHVAADALRAIDRGTPVVYTPRVWALVMAVIRRLPRSIMRSVGF
jgi:short-subunit dehydrogenase